MQTTVLAIVLLLALSATVAAQDILDRAAAHPNGTGEMEQPDGTRRKPKFGDSDLEQAESFLAGRYPRPWTVATALGWLQHATDEPTRVHLLRLLAASRDARAALALGAAADSKPLALRLAGSYGLLEYFVPGGIPDGGTEQHIPAAREWFTANKERLEREATTQ